MSCDGAGDIISHYEMQQRAKCRTPFGTVRWCGAPADLVEKAFIITRLGIEEHPDMPTYDEIDASFFYLLDAPMNDGGPTVIQRQKGQHRVPTILLFYRRGKGLGYQDLGPIAFVDRVQRGGHWFFKFKRLCNTQLKHAKGMAPGDKT